MKLHLNSGAGLFLIQSFSDTHIEIHGATFRESIIVCPDQPAFTWRHPQPQHLEVKDFSAVDPLRPEVVLLGTGPTLVFPDYRVIAGYHAAGTGFEVMTTAAACRTYNILAGDGRRVVAALMLDLN